MQDAAVHEGTTPSSRENHKRSRATLTADTRLSQQQVADAACSSRAPSLTLPPRSATSSPPTSSSPSTSLSPDSSCHPKSPPTSLPMWAGCFEDIGGRNYMEDRYICTEIVSPAHQAPVQVAGVFDGHGGHYVAEYLAANMARVLEQELAGQQGSEPAALHKSFMALDAALAQAQAGKSPSPAGWPQDDMGGSTAVVVICSPTAIVCANCGTLGCTPCRCGGLLRSVWQCQDVQ